MFFTNLLKKSFEIHEWDETCHKAFETFKGILVKVLMLELFDFDKKFEIHYDAFDFMIRGVLMQDGRQVAFESKKLSETKRKWPTHEKEMWVVIHCLKTLHTLQRCGVDRQCHLEIFCHSTKIVIKTNEMARHIMTHHQAS